MSKLLLCAPANLYEREHEQTHIMATPSAPPAENPQSRPPMYRATPVYPYPVPHIHNPNVPHYRHRMYHPHHPASPWWGRWWSSCAMGTLVLFAVVAAAALGVAIWGAVVAQYATSAHLHTASGELPRSPFTHLLGSAAPLAMTLPNDLTPYLGREFHVYAVTAQAHTITIQGGALTSTWDGTNTVATFGGAVGDGVTFVVIAADRVEITHNNNVVLS